MKKQIKSFISGAISAILLFSVIGNASATVGKQTVAIDYNDIKITMNGKAVQLVDANGAAVEPFVINGTTYLPIRAVATALGLDVNWNGETKTVELAEKQTENKGLLLDSNYIKATYLDVFEADGVNGVFYLSLQVENKSEKEIRVYLSDVSVNGFQTIAMSGMPMTIQPGNSSKNPFIISYSQLNIDNLDDLENISFKFTVADNETASTLFTSDDVTIYF